MKGKLQPDRRRPNRLVPPVCTDCQAFPVMSAVVRNNHVVYFRCPSCGLIGGLAKPRDNAERVH